MEMPLKKIRWSTLLYGMLTIFVVLLIVIIGVTYFAPRSSSVAQAFVARMPLPVAIIGYRNIITFRELSQNMQSVRRFYENQDFSKVGLRIDFSTDEGKKRLRVREKEVLNKLIEDEMVMLLAKERDIFVSREAARQGVARKLEEYGSSKEVKENLERLYGWTLTDFEEKVVMPGLYEEKLLESYKKEVDVDTAAKDKIEKATESLRQGESFSDVVKKYSEGETKESGGDLGWFALTDLAPELRSPVAAQKAGIPGNVVESQLGFHIILVEEKKTEKDGELYRISQVFTRKHTFADWLTEKMKTKSFLLLDQDYQYDEESARVEFRDEEWRKYEKELYEKAASDASFFF